MGLYLLLMVGHILIYVCIPWIKPQIKFDCVLLQWNHLAVALIEEKFYWYESIGTTKTEKVYCTESLLKWSYKRGSTEVIASV